MAAGWREEMARKMMKAEIMGFSQVRLSQLASSPWHVVHNNLLASMRMGGDTHALTMTQNTANTPGA